MNERKNLITDHSHFSKGEDKNILALGLYTPSQSIATAELRSDSLQNIAGVLAHAKFPARKEELIDCAVKRNSENEVIDTIKSLPSDLYSELSFVITDIIEEKLNSTKYP